MPKTPKAMPPHEVIREFGARQRAVTRTLVVAVIAWGAVIVAIMAVSVEAVPVWTPQALSAVAIVLMVPFARAGARYRCPACGAKPSSGDGEPGMRLNPPPQCGDCGVRLR